MTTKPLYLSATQLEGFDGTSAFGCARKWHLHYVQRIPEPTTDAMLLGTHLHALIEQHLGSLSAMVPAESQAHYLFEAIRPTVDAVKASGIMEVELPMEYSAPELPGIVFRGKIDVVLGDSVNGMCGVLDWKTSSDINKYAKTSGEIAGNVQLALYSRYLMEAHSKDGLRAHLIYVQTKGRVRVKEVSADILRPDIDKTFNSIILPRALQMQAAAKLENHYSLDYPQEKWKCKRCNYANICEDKNQVSDFLQNLLNRGKATIAAQTPAPIVEPVQEEIYEETPSLQVEIAEDVDENPVAVAPIVRPFAKVPAERPILVLPAPTITHAPAQVEEPVKRGPGRPRKYPLPESAPVAAVTAPVVNRAPPAILVNRAPPQPVQAPQAPVAPRPQPVVVEPAMSPTGRIREITVSHGLTLNLGQYNSARVDVTLKAEVGTDLEATLRMLEDKCKKELEVQLTTYTSAKKE